LCLREGGALLGGINFNEISRGPFQNAALGYWIGAPFAGKGYMSAGLGLALRYGFENLALHRLEANIRPENAASLALVRRAGFRREGFSRRYLQIDGAWRDHERWALLAEDWRQDEGFSDPSCGGSGSPGSRCDR
jgi:ribosomal-protein-alanine N-acetyltransferase